MWTPILLLADWERAYFDKATLVDPLPITTGIPVIYLSQDGRVIRINPKTGQWLKKLSSFWYFFLRYFIILISSKCFFFRPLHNFPPAIRFFTEELHCRLELSSLRAVRSWNCSISEEQGHSNRCKRNIRRVLFELCQKFQSKSSFRKKSKKTGLEDMYEVERCPIQHIQSISIVWYLPMSLNAFIQIWSCK